MNARLRPKHSVPNETTPRCTRRRAFWVPLVGAAALLLFGCEPQTPADAFRADPAALTRGKSLFVGTCAGYCHSPVVERAAPNLFDCVWKNGSGTDQELFDVIANGVPGTPMISFRGKLPEGDDDIWRLVAYIATTKEECESR